MLMVAALFLLGTLATPLHLLVDAHEGSHHEGSEPDPHEHSHHDPHPAADHQMDPALSTARPVPIVVDIAAVDFEVQAPEVRSWTPTIEAEANSPPACPESPPRSPRAPPL